MQIRRAALTAGAFSVIGLLAVVGSAVETSAFKLEGLNAEIATPDGCSWRENRSPQIQSTRFFVCAQADGQQVVTLMVEDKDLRLSPAENYFGPFKRGLSTAAERSGGLLGAFSYSRFDLGAPDSYRYQAETRLPRGNLYLFGYIQLYDRVYTVHSTSGTQQEPAVVLATARSIRLLNPVDPSNRAADRAGAAFELLLGIAAVVAAVYVWSRRAKRNGAQPAGPEPPEQGPGVHI